FSIICSDRLKLGKSNPWCSISNTTMSKSESPYAWACSMLPFGIGDDDTTTSPLARRSMARLSRRWFIVTPNFKLAGEDVSLHGRFRRPREPHLRLARVGPVPDEESAPSLGQLDRQFPDARSVPA